MNQQKSAKKMQQLNRKMQVQSDILWIKTILYMLIIRIWERYVYCKCKCIDTHILMQE